jgi:predicted SnoaL-like aldol condensation-catalyzing enzyme
MDIVRAKQDGQYHRVLPLMLRHECSRIPLAPIPATTQRNSIKRNISMKPLIAALLATALLVPAISFAEQSSELPGHHQMKSKRSIETNKQIALHALTGTFIDRDPNFVDKYFSPNYIQHNPKIPNGPAAIKDLIPKLPKDLLYQPGMAVAEGDLVMVHGRYVGWGPKPTVAVDIFRLKDGKIVEHWDVLQEEVPASATANGNPMFSPSEAK